MRNQKGLTLIEMMIAMVIGLLVVGTVITIFITNIRSNSDSVAMIRLNQELRGVMTFVSDEIKRAGYSAGAFDTYMAKLQVNTDNDCILYSYDEAIDSAVSVPPATFGFGLNANEIKWGTGASLVLATPCTFGSAITETNIAEITDFTVELSTVLAGTVEINQVEVTITGTTELSGGTTASRTISEVIRVRNDAL